MQRSRYTDRRTVLKTVGLGTVGAFGLSGVPNRVTAQQQVTDGFESGAYDDGAPVTWQVYSMGEYATVQSDVVKNGAYALEEKSDASTDTNTVLYHHADGFSIEDGDVYSAWMRCDGDVPRIDFSFGPEISKKPAHGVRVGVITDHDNLTMSTHDNSNNTLDRHHFGSANPRSWYFYEVEMYPTDASVTGRVYDSSKNLIGEKTLATTGETAFEYTNLWEGTPFGRMSIGWFDDVSFPGAAIEVTLDIRPCSDPNPIDPSVNSLIPVGIKQTGEFDPVSSVDVSTLRFGAPEVVENGGGATPAHDGHVEDVVPCDGDGKDDFVVHFPTADTGFDGDEAAGRLEGKTMDGTSLFGEDSVKVV